MIEPAALLAWSALALIVTLTPGPDTLLVAAHGARGGLRAGMAALAGIMTAIVVWYGSLIGFGALSVLVAVPMLFLAVKIAGALYLAWLGVGMIWGAVRRKRESAAPKPVDLRKPYAQGFFTNALNPKVALFYLAALPQFAGTGPDAPFIGVMLVGIHAAFGLIWLSFIAFAAARARSIVWNSAAREQVGRWLEGAVGVFFVGVAGRLALAQR
ncbi:MAG: LysE family translocator [Hyphomonadaceae bacterium]